MWPSVEMKFLIAIISISIDEVFLFHFCPFALHQSICNDVLIQSSFTGLVMGIAHERNAILDVEDKYEFGNKEIQQ